VEKDKINKVRNKKEEITKNTKEIQRHIRGYFESYIQINCKI
jgi:hypothetical protein